MPIQTRRSRLPMGPRPPIVGRSAEQTLLHEQLASAGSAQGAFILIGGEAGVGKTSLVRDLAFSASARGFHVLFGNAYDLTATAPYGLWLDLAARYEQAQDANPPVPVPTVLTHHDLPGFTSQADLITQLQTFLSDIIVETPVLLVLEDAHWADTASLDLLRLVASRLEGQRLLIVATYCLDELTRQNPFYRQLPSLVRESDGLRLDLKPLLHRDIAELVELSYGLSEPEQTRLVDYLDRFAEGNPLLTVELLRTLEQNELNETDSGWTLGALERVVLPSLVKQLTDVRIDRMGNDSRDPLAVAAVIGHEVPLDIWSTVTAIDPPTLYVLVENASGMHLLTPDTDGSSIRFVHALTRAALYDGILPPRRRLIHRQVADALIGRGQPDPDAVAYHLQQAGDPRTTEWLIRAGERAQRAYAWIIASERFATAAMLLHGTPSTEHLRARLLFRSGRLLRYADPEAAIERLEKARRLAEAANDVFLAADTQYSLGVVQCFADQWQAGIPNVAAGIDRLDALAEEEFISRDATVQVQWMADALPEIDLNTSTTLELADDRQATLNIRRGSLPWLQASIGQLDNALERTAARPGNTEMDGLNGSLLLTDTGHAEVGRGMALAARGEPHKARAAFARARDLYRRVDHHAVIGFSYLTELVDVAVPWCTADRRMRLELARLAERELARAGGALPGPFWNDLARLMVMYLDGEWEAAREAVHELPHHMPYFLRRQITHALAPIARYQGRRKAAWRHIEQLQPTGPATAPGTTVLLDALTLQRLAIELSIDDRDIDRAQQWLDANHRWLEWSGAALGVADNYLSRARLARASSDHERAWAYVQEALSRATSPPQPLVLITGHRMAGEIALDCGEHTTAEVELSRALDLSDDCAIPWERAQTLVSLAALHQVTGDQQAVELAHVARAICESLHAQPVLDRLDRLGIQPAGPGVSPPGSGELTPREIDVLRLVPHGFTNTEIGERLCIGHRTVGHHLHSIYRKLDVKTRTGAAKFALDHGIS